MYWALYVLMTLGESFHLPRPPFTKLQNEDLTYMALILGVL